MGRLEALSYWVVSDHFEELGRPPALLHGGFGLRTVGELRKPRWWALALLERLGTRQLGADADRRRSGLAGRGARGDRAGAGGEVTTLVWNLTLDQTKASGSDDLCRRVRIDYAGLTPGATYTLHHDRVDDEHSDIAAVWGRLKEDDQDWPTAGAVGAPAGGRPARHPRAGPVRDRGRGRPAQRGVRPADAGDVDGGAQAVTAADRPGPERVSDRRSGPGGRPGRG